MVRVVMMAHQIVHPMIDNFVRSSMAPKRAQRVGMNQTRGCVQFLKIITDGCAGMIQNCESFGILKARLKEGQLTCGIGCKPRAMFRLVKPSAC